MQTDHWCRYDRELRAAREEAPVAETAGDAQSRHGNVRLQYQSQGHFERLAAAFGMMSEWRDGVPRARIPWGGERVKPALCFKGMPRDS